MLIASERCFLETKSTTHFVHHQNINNILINWEFSVSGFAHKINIFYVTQADTIRNVEANSKLIYFMLGDTFWD